MQIDRLQEKDRDKIQTEITIYKLSDIDINIQAARDKRVTTCRQALRDRPYDIYRLQEIGCLQDIDYRY